MSNDFHKDGKCDCGKRVLLGESAGEWTVVCQEYWHSPVSTQDQQGKKFDDGKPPLGRLPRIALIEDAQVYDFGRKKYDWDNWRKGISWHRQLDAALRHIYAFIDGEDLDPESGLCHLAHARVDLAMVSEYRKTHPELDDRYKNETKSKN